MGIISADENNVLSITDEDKLYDVIGTLSICKV